MDKHVAKMAGMTEYYERSMAYDFFENIVAAKHQHEYKMA